MQFIKIIQIIENNKILAKTAIVQPGETGGLKEGLNKWFGTGITAGQETIGNQPEKGGGKDETGQ